MGRWHQRRAERAALRAEHEAEREALLAEHEHLVAELAAERAERAALIEQLRVELGPSGAEARRHLSRALDFLDRPRRQWTRASGELKSALGLVPPQGEAAELIREALGACTEMRYGRVAVFPDSMSGWDADTAADEARAQRERCAASACRALRLLCNEGDDERAVA